MMRGSSRFINGMKRRMLAESSLSEKLRRWVVEIPKRLQKRPLLTNCLVFGSVSGLAEFSQQTILYKMSPCKEERKQYDMEAVGRFALLGGAMFAPILHFWFGWLDKILPGTGASTVIKKVILDAVMLDVPYYTLFYMAMGTMESKPWRESLEEVKVKLLPTVLYSLLLWIPAQTINFRFVPPHMRVVYIALVTFLEFNMLAMLKRIPHGCDEAVKKADEVECVKAKEKINKGLSIQAAL